MKFKLAENAILEKTGKVTLAAATRDKAATHGVAALQVLLTQQDQDAHGVNKAIHIRLGAVAAQAGEFARENGVEVRA